MRVPIVTNEGRFVAHYSDRGLSQLNFPDSKRKDDGLDADFAELPSQVKQWHLATTRALKEILAGRARNDLPPLDLSKGTEFQQRVWSLLRQISTGQTKSYAEVAAGIGKPKATRAVGSACGANPIPVLIPCHRVLAANHGLGGFSGGLDWKRKLLAREGIQFD